jgi:hypothetical protein
MAPGRGGGIGKDREKFADKDDSHIYIVEPRNAFRVRLSREKVNRDFGSPFPEKPWDGQLEQSLKLDNSINCPGKR